MPKIFHIGKKSLYYIGEQNSKIVPPKANFIHTNKKSSYYIGEQNGKKAPPKSKFFNIFSFT